ncbi:AsnC family transcriptional regulator [Clostridium bovifaecis]|uniref:siroheme decarboxylase n=1 Tax=Clostridium bovifaecis TaxID=2184719 RepID=A0A6I6F2H2_9CLOT|nr:AsnC family transcriptional regulator [Clostridium bovifaecis]
MDELDRKILIEVSKDISVCESPYDDIAKRLKISTDSLLSRIKILQDSGYIKRISAIVAHEKTDYKINAMTVWKVDEINKKNIIELMKRFPNVSHIYERRSAENWEYNIYGMMHAVSKEEIESLIEYISKQINVSDYKALYTKKQWKKTSPVIEELL